MVYVWLAVCLRGLKVVKDIWINGCYRLHQRFKPQKVVRIEMIAGGHPPRKFQPPVLVGCNPFQ
jgi:hypothetical protein